MSRYSDTSSKAAPVPANDYERFLAALPESLRDECRYRLTGSGLSPDHPVFQLLADFHEQTPASTALAPDFLEEARLHSDRSKQILSDFEGLPEAILARLEPQLVGVAAALTRPIERLENAAIHLQRNVEALPVLLLSNRFSTSPPPDKWWKFPWWWIGKFARTGSLALSNHTAWIVTGSICLCAAVAVLIVGASHLSRYYESNYEEHLAHLEADSAQTTLALNRLLAAGISIKVERDAEDSSYYLIFPGAKKAADPINTPEGLAVQLWP